MGNLKCTILAIFTSGSVAPYTLTPLCSRPALTGTSRSETQSRLNATVLLSRPPSLCTWLLSAPQVSGVTL